MILKVTDAAVHYGGVKAVDGVSFALNPGEIHGLIGPNGAGKSTVIDAISGRRGLTRGNIHLAGQDITRLSVIDRRRLGLARSFQRTSIFPKMSVCDQIGLAAHKVGAEAPEQDARHVMDQLDLSGVANAVAGSLGYGQQRRLDLALALVGRPIVLLLDEPMAGLSPQESTDLATHLQKLTKDWGVSILLVEHDTDTLFSISNSVTVFELGHIIASGRPDDVRIQPRVREAYLGSAA
ncbi:ABC transporter ATP-binding protein [Castellaniella sp. MT123]|uniref:ABC transporter ATP-binding protein n=1 Tax=Castellaniella sp. MT123 TaxID=3140381 RepID=UPI0031F3461F